jgi:hypothetical protein
VQSQVIALVIYKVVLLAKPCLGSSEKCFSRIKINSSSYVYLFYQSHVLPKSCSTKVMFYQTQVLPNSGSTKLRFYQSQVNSIIKFCQIPFFQSQVLPKSCSTKVHSTKVRICWNVFYQSPFYQSHVLPKSGLL